MTSSSTFSLKWIIFVKSLVLDKTETLLENSDIVTNHCDLTEETTNLLSNNEFNELLNRQSSIEVVERDLLADDYESIENNDLSSVLLNELTLTCFPFFLLTGNSKSISLLYIVL